MSKFSPNPFLAVCLMLAMTVAATAQSADFNNDGVFNCDDVGPLSVDIANGTHTPIYDLDADGLVTRSDLSQWLTIAGNSNIGAPYILGDLLLEGRVDNSSYTGVWDTNRNTTQPTDGYCDGDINADGHVDISDGLIIKANFLLEPSLSAGVGNGESLVPSDLAGFIYDPDSGQMYIRSDSTRLTGIVLAGPEPSIVHSFEEPFVDGVAWSTSRHFAGKQQWFGWEIIQQSLLGTLGHHLLATYEPGLTSADFGTVEYGAYRLVQDLDGVLSTQVQVDTVLPGDANLDGFVDVTDFNLWNENKFTDDASWGEGDFNNDGLVDASDFNLWNQNKFTSAGWDGEPTVVPEPGGLLLAIFALVAILKLEYRPPFSRSERRLQAQSTSYF